MGKGDKKSKKGKQSQGSYGNSRPKHDRNKEAQLSNVALKTPVASDKKAAPAKKVLKAKS